MDLVGFGQVFDGWSWAWMSPGLPGCARGEVLSCYNEHQVNVEDIHLTREMIEQYQQQHQQQATAQGTTRTTTAGTTTVASLASS